MPFRRVIPVAAAVLVLALTGCVGPEIAPSLPTDPPVTATPLPTPTIEPTTGVTPIEVGCEDLVAADAVYALNPNLALIGPADDTESGTIALAAGGVTCRWVLESGGTGMDVVAARLSASDLGEREAAVAGGESVPGWGDRGFFTSRGGAGVATVFSGDVWLEVASDQFGTAADATGIVESALAAVAG